MAGKGKTITTFKGKADFLVKFMESEGKGVFTGPLPIASLKFEDTQVRIEVQEETVDNYAELLEAGHEFPAIEVFYDDTSFWPCGGQHRAQAHLKAGKKFVICTVRKGSCREALFASAGSNARHGLQLTREDKRNVVDTLLDDEEWAEMSDGAIARHVGVSDRFVASRRSQRSTPNVRSAKRKGTDGRYIDTTNIGTGKKKHGTGKPPADPDSNGEPPSEKKSKPTALEHEQMAFDHLARAHEEFRKAANPEQASLLRHTMDLLGRAPPDARHRSLRFLIKEAAKLDPEEAIPLLEKTLNDIR